ncbi:heterokaryon incompatibility protein-domain-containing protein [Thelonectria olida]|uniref:Heterokaryon incompatibility protein-domain-containing protein n=1 Tax=Thelonectria olida TaxID=1576542 RepID=A0A9P8W1T5_9HYPO|nr:heterokaryon incompatibility protein-domain-containing protein [Thelonectria olida]
MEVEAVSDCENDLCAACLQFAKALSLRTKVLSLGISMNATTGFWPTSPGCRLCKIISDHLKESDSRTVPSKSLKLSYNVFAVHKSLSCLNIDTAQGYRVGCSVWSDIGSPAASSGLVATVPPLPSDNCPVSFGLIRSWIQGCLHNHESCKESMAGNFVNDEDGPQLPTRVLDICGADTGIISLVESKGLKAKFCALSYCWGNGQDNVLTTRENIKRRLAGIELQSLPQTFKDAIKVTREVGIRYLWVDSLCIIQGDRVDWAQEASRMVDVYQNAFLVIGASAASSPREGCFSKKVRSLAAVELPHYSSSGLRAGSLWLSIDSPTGPDEFPVYGILNSRGWALQEWHLARRMLHFMPDGISWHCKGLECGERKFLYFPQQRHFEWDHVLTDFSRRQLTYETDRLPALQGLADAYAETNADTYLFGTFESGLPAQLIWMFREELLSPQHVKNVPSWSWASKLGDKMFWSTRFSISPMGRHTCLQMKESGTLEVTGPLAHGTLSKSPINQASLSRESLFSAMVSSLRSFRKAPLQTLEASDGGFDPIGIAAMDEAYSGKVYLAFLAMSSWEQWEKYHVPQISTHPYVSEFQTQSRQLYWVLLLAPSETTTGCFSRIGIGLVHRDPDGIDASHTTTRII